MSRQSLTPTLLIAALTAAPLAAQTTQPTPAATSAPKPLTTDEEARFLALGKKYVRWFLHGDADSLAKATPTDVLEKLGGPDGIRKQMLQVAQRAGSESSVLAERMTRRNGYPQFWHEGNFTQYENEPIVIRFVLDDKGLVVGVGVGPKSQAPADPN